MGLREVEQIDREVKKLLKEIEEQITKIENGLSSSNVNYIIFLYSTALT